ncbi:ABC transporter ATP-binding protein [Anaerocolumna sp. MB42-C2]|uniref:ABC transporter ATP-binding protein n=1 Tax=Anaerocolumna sp. MB42-C2 TaxID=3070997 RepID=UPI0027DEF779|nr:ABC transporter ATP-binding protein [Anaerocolumna sp. MB42-C2]WMJ85561.1 ABC transporter ATP-binding protein [Anaerocolumna sp. MB42-C2]
MKKSIQIYTNLLTKYLKNSKLQLFMLAIIMGGSIIIQLINPQIVSFFIDGIEKQKPMDTLFLTAGLFILSALVQQVLAVASTYFSQNIGWRATNALRLDLVKHCLGLDMTFFKEHQSGEIVERIDGDVTALFNFFSKLFVSFLNNIFLMTGIIVILMIQNTVVGIAFILFLLLAFGVMWKTQRGATYNFGKEREINAQFYGFLGEHIGCTEDIQTNGARNYVMSRFYGLLRNWLPVQLKAFLSGYKIWITLEGIFGMGNIMIFALGGYLWFAGKISLGMVYLMINYIQLLEKPLEQLREQLLDIQKASASIIRMEELFQMKSKLETEEEISGDLSETFPVNSMNHSAAAKNIKESKNFENNISLKLDQVSFEYEENVPVLKDISFELPAGKILGILGHTGCGKTTLARLIIRFYDPLSGSIYLNNRPLKSIGLKELREHIAYVTQEVQLFHANVRDNITFFNPAVEDSLIIKTIYEMGLKDWYENLSNGLDTMIQSGGGMSSGEAQLLTLVRIFLKNPKLVILDEASARLDPITEKLVDKALSKLMEGRACIIIAHRLGTVERADDILILDGGSILEYGTRELLLQKKNSKLNELLRYGIEEVLV